MKHILLLIAVLSVSACGMFGNSEPEEISIKKVEREPHVMRSGTNAFDSCPPLHAEQGRC